MVRSRPLVRQSLAYSDAVDLGKLRNATERTPIGRFLTIIHRIHGVQRFRCSLQTAGTSFRQDI